MDNITEKILRKRMHGLYLSRKCDSITDLSRELIGLHCWFHRNVVFSAYIRGADLTDWKNSLTKTWVHHALHGVANDDLPTLLAVNSGGWRWGELYKEIADKAMSLMEDGVYSRAEMRKIFADEYDRHTIERAFSAWGGIFCELARLGKVAFRDMTSRDFDLIDAEPTQSFNDVLPDLIRRFFSSYGPATINDAAWFFGLQKERKQAISNLNFDEYSHFEYNKKIYYYIDDNNDIGDIPEFTLLSGFDPLIVSYIDRTAVLPPEYKNAVIMKSGICLPTIAVNGKVAGLWNIKKNEPVFEFFSEQPKYIKDLAYDAVNDIYLQTREYL